MILQICFVKNIKRQSDDSVQSFCGTGIVPSDEEKREPRMKKLTSILLALALVLSLAACGGAASSSVASSAASSEAVPEAASEAASSEEAKELSTTDALRIAGLKGPTTMGRCR